MKNLISIFLIFSFNFIYSDTTITAFSNVHHFFGNSGNNRTLIENVEFPLSNDGYSEIIMNISLECPNGGCDPWDRKANISIKQFGTWYEIGRYVTPYGIGCGWSYNVTDYRSILKGSVEIKSYIDTWVEPGWLVTVDFTFITGTPFTPNTIVRNIWNSEYIVYGDETNPPNIPTVQEYIPNDAQYVKLRITTTGHGQGNTDNAAEFSYKNHEIIINDDNSIIHDFWRDDCEYNQCSPQFGTWQYDRAGFCPGDKVLYQDFDLNNLLPVGQVSSLDYVLDDYFNECSPNNSNCIDGQTCSDCDYNYNGHTEPFYFISSHLIIYSENYHSNADNYVYLQEQDSLIDELQVNLENYVPIYGIQFSINSEFLQGFNIADLEFISASGGRAHEFEWTFSINNQGTLVGLAQNLGTPLPPGEGILTNIVWNGNDIENLSGQIGISNVEISGNFGTELSYEVGKDILFNSNLKVESEPKIIVNDFNLLEPYPNPFNPVIQIKYEILKPGKFSILIFDLRGNLIEKILEDDFHNSGLHSTRWSGQKKSSGVYFIVLRSSQSEVIKKVILLK
ncbi:MAG: peptide-N-glycosidase F-related protein [Candidatus Neomarinimicrobiota bacterium]